MTEEKSQSSAASSPAFASSRSPSRARSNSGQTQDQDVNNAALSKQEAEPSDLPQLIRTHETLGYRAGLSDGKDHAEGVQAAFDEGYPFGAKLGMEVGWLLRRLAEPDVLPKLSAETLDLQGDKGNFKYEDAVRELSVQNLLGQIEELGILENEIILSHKDVERENQQEQSIQSIASSSRNRAFTEKLPAIARWSRIARGK